MRGLEDSRSRHGAYFVFWGGRTGTIPDHMRSLPVVPEFGTSTGRSNKISGLTVKITVNRGLAGHLGGQTRQLIVYKPRYGVTGRVYELCSRCRKGGVIDTMF